jgi:hypothetical protein
MITLYFRLMCLNCQRLLEDFGIMDITTVLTFNIESMEHCPRCQEAEQRVLRFNLETSNLIDCYDGRTLKVVTDEGGQYVVDRSGRRVFLEFEAGK